MPFLLIALLAVGGFALYEMNKHKGLPPGPNPVPGPVPGPGPSPGPTPNVVPTVYGDTPHFTSGTSQLIDGHAYYVDVFRSDLDPSVSANPAGPDQFGGTLFENVMDAHFFQNGAGDYHNFQIDNSDPTYVIANFVAVGNTTVGGSGLNYALHDMGTSGGQTAAMNPDQSPGGAGGGEAGGGGPIGFGYPSTEGGAGPVGSSFRPQFHTYLAQQTAGRGLPVARNRSRDLWQGYAAPSGREDEPK